jgi:Icc-related predicted phosphoesterase
MNILAISDTHSMHNNFEDSYFKDVDMVIHAGDCSNYRDPYRNEQEVRDFITWFSSLSVKYKIYIAGNHDTSIEHGLITEDNFKQANITYLEHEDIEIEGIRLFGSPYTPRFNDWAFNVNQNKMDRIWRNTPENTDILITHGPPKYILDISTDREGTIEYCGDKALLNKVLEVQPKYHIFGHIHNFKEHYNAGTKTIPKCKTTFVNASCVYDGKFTLGLTSFGHKFTI